MNETHTFIHDLTNAGLYFEIISILGALGIIYYGIRHYKFFLWRFTILAFGVFAFESLTSVLWVNNHLGNYAYIYRDISWIMMMAWTSILFGMRFIFDAYESCFFTFKKGSFFDRIPNNKTLREFITVILGSSIAGFVLLVILGANDIFSYAGELQKAIDSETTILGRPLESIFYFPAFMFIVYSFYKYWELAMYNSTLFATYKIFPRKDITIIACIVFLIGYLINPIIVFSSPLSYFGLIILYIVILMITNLLMVFARKIPLLLRFIMGTFVFTIFGSLSTEMLIKYKMIGISRSIQSIPVENNFYIPYLSASDLKWGGIFLFAFLMIATIRYLKIITDGHEIKLNDNKMTFNGWRSIFPKKISIK